MALVQTDIGNIFREKGEKKKAEEHFEQALHIRKKKGNLVTPDGAELLRFVGILRHQQKDYKGALDKLHEAKDIRERIAMMETGAGAALWNNIGNTKREMEDYDGAIKAHNTALALYSAAKSEAGKAAALKGIAHTQKLRDMAASDTK
eukprot:6350599-Amphidinium_carterae.1